MVYQKEDSSMSIQVLKRKSGFRYRACVKVGGDPQKHIFLSRKEAVAWINTVRHRRDSNLTYLRSVTIKEMFDAYIDHCASKNRALNSINNCKIIYKKYLFPVFNTQDMVALKIEQHEAFLSNIPKHFSIKPATINRIRSMMQAMYTLAMRKRFFGGSITSNPYTCIEKLPEIHPEIKYWGKEDVEKFLAHVNGTHYYPLFVLMLNTGMRIGECVSLDRSAVDTRSDVITVRRTWCDISKAPVERTKGRRIRRIGIAEMPIVKKTLYPILPDVGLVFKNERTGKQVNRDGITKDIFPRLCKEAGVPNITVHGLRHTFASHFMMNGGNINELAEMLGHSSVQLTRDYYLHFSEEHIQRRGRVVQFGNNRKVLKGNFGGGK